MFKVISNLEKFFSVGPCSGQQFSALKIGMRYSATPGTQGQFFTPRLQPLAFPPQSEQCHIYRRCPDGETMGFRVSVVPELILSPLVPINVSGCLYVLPLPSYQKDRLCGASG